MKKPAERARLIFGERTSLDKAVLAIQRERRLESRASSGFKAQPEIVAPTRLANDVQENCTADASSQMTGIRSHRLDLAGTIAKSFKRPDASKLRAMPR